MGLGVDLRSAVRQHSRRPRLAATVVATVALGLGVTTAIFSIASGLLWEPLPFGESDRLVQLVRPSEDLVPGFNSLATYHAPAHFLELREYNRTFADLTVFSDSRSVIATANGPTWIVSGGVSDSFFRVLGVSPFIGSDFDPRANHSGTQRVAVLEHGFWLRQFGGDASILGTEIRLDDVPTTIIGVMPPGFDFQGTELFFPLVFDEAFLEDTSPRVRVLGRLRKGVGVDQASVDLSGIMGSISANTGNPYAKAGVAVLPYRSILTRAIRPALLLLLVAAGIVFIIVCANVASLLLVRAAARSSEFAMRSALGASRAHMARQLVVESFLLAAAGGVAGMCVGMIAAKILLLGWPPDVIRPAANLLRMNVVVFASTGVVLCTLLVGLAPVWLVGRTQLVNFLKPSGRSLGSTGRPTLRRAIVMAEVALTVMLLIGAGLLVRSYFALTGVESGYNADDTVVFELRLMAPGYDEEHQSQSLFANLLDEIANIPGVEAAGGVIIHPLQGIDWMTGFELDGKDPLPPGENGENLLRLRVATSGYFRTMEIPVLAGRAFGETDRKDTPRVLIVNEHAAQKFFPNKNPVGQTLKLAFRWDDTPFIGEIVGVIGNVRQYGPSEGHVPEVYIPYSQVGLGSMSIVARTTGEPLSIVAPARARLRAMDANLAFSAVQPMRQALTASVARQKYAAHLVSAFAVLALILAAIGIAGVVGQAIEQQRNEIGIRLALGASRANVVRVIGGGGTKLVLGGAAIGLVGAVVATRTLDSFLFEVSTNDPAVFVGVLAIVGAIAVASAYVPAFRAASVDPAVVLRSQ